ncbi:MAG: hydroxymethylbilane synthase, partial [Solirubrobacteraceae bacterium]
MTPLRIGTRGSLLALAQARAVAAALAPGTELVTITTAGDVDR